MNIISTQIISKSVNCTQCYLAHRALQVSSDSEGSKYLYNNQSELGVEGVYLVLEAKTFTVPSNQLAKHCITVPVLASAASPVTDHVNGYLDLCLALGSMMRMLSKYIRKVVYRAYALRCSFSSCSEASDSTASSAL